MYVYAFQTEKCIKQNNKTCSEPLTNLAYMYFNTLDRRDAMRCDL